MQLPPPSSLGLAPPLVNSPLPQGCVPPPRVGPGGGRAPGRAAAVGTARVGRWVRRPPAAPQPRQPRSTPPRQQGARAAAAPAAALARRRAASGPGLGHGDARQESRVSGPGGYGPGWRAVGRSVSLSFSVVFPPGTRCSSWAARSCGSSGPTSSCWRCGRACRSPRTPSSSASPWSECGGGGRGTAVHGTALCSPGSRSRGGSGSAAQMAQRCPGVEERAPILKHPLLSLAPSPVPHVPAQCFLSPPSGPQPVRLAQGRETKCQIAPFGLGEKPSSIRETSLEG